MKRTRLVLLLPLLGACDPGPRQQEALDRWFACMECNRGELDSVEAAQGLWLVWALARQLGGPPEEELARVRVRYLAEYRQVAAVSAAPLAESEGAFVDRLLANFVAERVKRSARALARIDSWMARRALREALGFAERAEFADRYRSDVLAELRAAQVTSVTVAAGDGQTDTVGRAVDIPPSVLVQAETAPAAGVPVAFRVVTGGGSVTGSMPVTDATGQATVGSWTLGPVPGLNRLVAVAGRDSVTIDATALAGLLLQVVAGEQQSARPGDTVATAPVLRALDAAGQPESGVLIRFEILAGNGLIGKDSVFTDADGFASPGRWTLGASGLNLLAARATGRPEVHVRAYALPPPGPIPP